MEQLGDRFDGCVVAAASAERTPPSPENPRKSSGLITNTTRPPFRTSSQALGSATRGEVGSGP